MTSLRIVTADQRLAEPALPGTHCLHLPDNDDAGRSHANKVATALHGIADGVRIVDLPGLPKGGDVSDWLDLGSDAGRLVQLCQAAPLWEPAACAILRATTGKRRAHPLLR